MSKEIKTLQEYIDNANKIVFFGGAGVSTESGIPDFRSKDGLYNKPDVQFEKYEPEYLLSSYCLYDEPEVFYEFYRQKMDTRNVDPNIAHYKLAELEKVKDLWIVTQNIDGLHQKAGSKNVLEIHGTAQVCHCRKCGKEYPASYIFDCKETVPRCHACEGEINPYCTQENAIIRPNITLYGEMLPPAFRQAANKIMEADLLIVGGTSLSVYPANSLVNKRIFNGKLVIINMSETEKDNIADLVIHDSLGKVFEQLKF